MSLIRSQKGLDCRSPEHSKSATKDLGDSIIALTLRACHLVAGKTPEQHREHLLTVFTRQGAGHQQLRTYSMAAWGIYEIYKLWSDKCGPL